MIGDGSLQPKCIKLCSVNLSQIGILIHQQTMTMNESSPYDTGNNKWIGRVMTPTTGNPYYQVRFTANIPGKFTASGYPKQKVLFVKLFYFHKYKSEKSCLTAARTVRNREAAERGLSLKQRRPNVVRTKLSGDHKRAWRKPTVDGSRKLNGLGDAIRQR